MATVGNGHIATVVYSDTIYMNGLYNGERGESHRARIPSYINVRVQSPEIVPRRYALDTEKGNLIFHISSVIKFSRIQLHV